MNFIIEFLTFPFFTLYMFALAFVLNKIFARELNEFKREMEASDRLEE